MNNSIKTDLVASPLVRQVAGYAPNLKRAVLVAAVGAVAFSSLLASPASATIVARVIVPDSDIHKPLGDNGPDGKPATSGCRWSRLQIPTVMGLRWVAEEECGTDAN